MSSEFWQTLEAGALGACCVWGVALLFYGTYQLGWMRGHGEGYGEASRWHVEWYDIVLRMKGRDIDFEEIAKRIQAARATRPPHPVTPQHLL